MLGEGKENTACFNWGGCGCFSFIKRTFANYVCPCSDRALRMLLFALISLGNTTADMDCWVPFLMAGYQLPKQLINLSN